MGRPPANEVVATIVSPDGARRSTVLERKRATAEALAPRVGIDARGTATAAWTRWNVISGRYVLRAAHAVAGAAWTPAGSLGAGADPVYDFLSVGQVDVAVAPGGRTLLAWADGRGVRAAVDGGTAERLTAENGAGSPAVAIGDDASAVVAYARPRRGSWRWTAARAARGRPRTCCTGRGGPVPSRPRPTRERAAPDGRAAVAWDGVGEVGLRVFAASGRPGGAWTAASPLSAITREATSPSLALGAAGDPRRGLGRDRAARRGGARLRGARLAPDAEAVAGDHVAPVIDTHHPEALAAHPLRRGRAS